MFIKVGVRDGATGLLTQEQTEAACLLGRAIAKNGCVLITGAIRRLACVLSGPGC
jgi:hypothetical protein